MTPNATYSGYEVLFKDLWFIYEIYMVDGIKGTDSVHVDVDYKGELSVFLNGRSLPISYYVSYPRT